VPGLAQGRLVRRLFADPRIFRPIAHDAVQAAVDAASLGVALALAPRSPVAHLALPLRVHVLALALADQIVVERAPHTFSQATAILQALVASRLVAFNSSVSPDMHPLADSTAEPRRCRRRLLDDADDDRPEALCKPHPWPQ